MTLLPVKLWSVYEDVHGIFQEEGEEGVQRLVIGENPFGADYGYLVLLRTDSWLVQTLIENIPEVTDRGSLSEFIASEPITNREHSADVKQFLDDEGIDVDGVRAAVEHARSYFGFASPERKDALVAEWEGRSAAWAEVLAEQLRQL